MQLGEQRSGAGGARTLVDLVRYRAAANPTRIAYSYWGDDASGVGDELSNGQLDQKARVIASFLRKRAQPGDRVLLVFPPGLEFIEAFFGVL